MSDIDDIIAVDIDAKLNAIPDVSVLPGYLVHYANDLLNAINGIGDGSVFFPCVAYQPVSDIPSVDQRQTRSVNSRIMRVIGCVDVTDPAAVNTKLNELLLSVRKALAINVFKEKSKASSIEIGDAVFNLPDSQDQYAFFEMDVTIKYVEKWES